MDANNLATMFGPNILRRDDLTMEGILHDTVHVVVVVQTMIVEYTSIFQKQDALSSFSSNADSANDSMSSYPNDPTPSSNSDGSYPSNTSSKQERNRSKTVTGSSELPTLEKTQARLFKT